MSNFIFSNNFKNMAKDSNLNIAIISYHFSEDDRFCNSRPLLVYQVIKKWSNFNKTSVYCSNFDHFKKSHVNFINEDYKAIKVPTYKKNISFMRLFSYTIFSLKLLANLELKQYDIIYICVPPNSSAFVGLLYKFMFKKLVVIDVVDLWPEGFPLSQMIKVFIEILTKPLRNLLFKQADLILTQSDYFRDKLNFSDSKCKTLLMGSSIQPIVESPLQESLKDCIRLLYLGSLNTIIDIDSLVEITRKLAKYRKVHLTVIGGGERLEYLQEEIKNIHLNVTTAFYGICFDSEIKEKEFSKAHFGYNGYIDSTEIALSYKSLEYLANGIPLLNSTKGDTANLVKETGCGFNFHPRDIDVLVAKILGLDDNTHATIKTRAIEVFESNFSWAVFQERLSSLLEDIL